MTLFEKKRWSGVEENARERLDFIKVLYRVRTCGTRCDGQTNCKSNLSVDEKVGSRYLRKRTVCNKVVPTLDAGQRSVINPA